MLGGARVLSGAGVLGRVGVPGGARVPGGAGVLGRVGVPGGARVPGGAGGLSGSEVLGGAVPPGLPTVAPWPPGAPSGSAVGGDPRGPRRRPGYPWRSRGSGGARGGAGGSSDPASRGRAAEPGEDLARARLRRELMISSSTITSTMSPPRAATISRTRDPASVRVAAGRGAAYASRGGVRGVASGGVAVRAGLRALEVLEVLGFLLMSAARVIVRAVITVPVLIIA